MTFPGFPCGFSGSMLIFWKVNILRGGLPEMKMTVGCDLLSKANGDFFSNRYHIWSPAMGQCCIKVHQREKICEQMVWNMFAFFLAVWICLDHTSFWTGHLYLKHPEASDHGEAATTWTTKSPTQVQFKSSSGMCKISSVETQRICRANGPLVGFQGLFGCHFDEDLAWYPFKMSESVWSHKVRQKNCWTGSFLGLDAFSVDWSLFVVVISTIAGKGQQPSATIATRL